MNYMNKHDYMRDKLKIPKVDLTSAFDKAGAEKDLEDAEWTSLLSGEPSLSGPPQPPTFGDKKKKDSPIIDLTKSSSTSCSAVSTPEISDEGEKEEEDKLAESMVKSLLIEKDEEEKPISTPENANN